jgi:DNA-binding CsgD family transcriptional regulator
MENGSAVAEARTSLRGRADECASLDGLLADVRRGEGRALVLRGEAGIGKTALLGFLVESASDMTVLRAAGVESEMELAYASLHQLCVPLLDRLQTLPGPQSEALRVVFGLTAGPPPDRFLVGLGVLSLLSEVAEERPLLCAVDDAQWLDQASALTLAFVARRLLAERVGIVFATRQHGEELQHVSGLDVRGLRDGDARALLGTAVRFILDERVRERIIAETRGNPLALLELPRGLTATQLAVGFGLVDPQSLPGRIEESFIRRLEALPKDARRLLLLAAVEPVGDPVLLWRAAEQLGIEPAAGDRVESDGLLAIGERVVFRHPLVRSAVYRSSSLEDRRAVHLALARATDREVDPDRRAWHLAAATTGPDEDVAAELERSAGRAQARGGLAAAAAFLRSAVGLSDSPELRAERALAAAQTSIQAGAFDAARALLTTAEGGPLDELQRTRVELLRGQIGLLSAFGGDAASRLLSAAQRLERLDPILARDTYLDAWGAALLAGRLGTRVSLLDIARAARVAPHPDGAPRPSDLLLDSLAMLITDGPAAAAAALQHATRTFADEEFPIEASLRWGWLAVVPTYALWDEKGNYKICVRQLQAVRRVGALARLPLDLNTLSLLAVRCGDFAGAAAAIAEADAVADAIGSHVPPFSAMMLAVLRGQEADALALIESVRQEASAAGQGVAIQLADWMAAILFNGAARYPEALACALEASTDHPAELFIAAWAAVELLEAAVRSANREVAQGALDRVTAATSFSSTDSAQGILARSRALLSEGEDAEGFYRRAIEQLSRTRLRPELARTHLLYGEWLRRENRRLDARTQLRLAHETFTSIGMEAFAERARRELVATGEHVHRRTVETRDDLTAQERQVALLARDGMSNIEIGARLYLSQHTVAYHLRKVFSKLGINSRRELPAALPRSESELVLA